jgi:PncC family amidohydrolase
MKLEKAIGDYLREKRWKISIAESCTGGLVSDRITNVSGSSDYFEGGMVNYSNESKEKHLGIPLAYIKKYGAVSPEVARRMAQGVRKAFGTTFGLSTTGVAGPTGGTKRSPVGRVYIGLANGRRTWVKELDLKGNRRKIKEQAAEKSLQFFYGIIVEKAGFRTEAQSPQ